MIQINHVIHRKTDLEKNNLKSQGKIWENNIEYN